MRIALVAGETSGDTLGAALIEALRRQFPDAEFAGVAGPKMKAAGCMAWHDIEELAVMGLTEVDHASATAMAAARRACAGRSSSGGPTSSSASTTRNSTWGWRKQLKRAGLTTVQYVSPQVWAWRQGRVRTIGESVDLVLCLFPFEPDFYREHGVRAAFVGHPLADQIPLRGRSRRGARRTRHRRRRARAGGVAGQPPWRSREAGGCVRRRRRIAGRAISRASSASRPW